MAVKNSKIYLYDSSFDGLLTCIFEAFEYNETPVDISYDPDTLLPYKFIDTEKEKANRVKRALVKRCGKNIYRAIYFVYLSREKGCELNILSYCRFIFSNKKANLYKPDDPIVYKIFSVAKSVSRERHHIIEFTRFSDINGNLVAIIDPKYFILPLIAPHFKNRFFKENFLIFDEVHCAALLHTAKSTEIMPLEEYTMPEPSQEENKFRSLWKLFYDTVEIKQRRNYLLRQNLMPKRFWKNLTEMKNEFI